jgi:hypothetical protein
MCPNLVITCSKSGKLDKNLVNYFNENVIKSYINSDFALIIDSWTGQKDYKMYENKFGEFKCNLLIIPPHCTPLIQPLDVFCFGQIKAFVKRLTNIIKLHKFNINLSSRKDVIKLHSITHNQLSAEIYTNMLRYGWFKPGYIEAHPGEFVTIEEFCFKNIFKNNCEYSVDCDNFPIIVCSHCKKHLCIEHLFSDEFFHYH